MNDQTFDALKKKAEQGYRSVGDVLCPYLSVPVRFNREGLEHVLFKGRGRARPRTQQETRLQLLHYAPKVIRQSHTVQGVYPTVSFVDVRRNNRRDRVRKEVTYYEFIAVVDKIRIRVIVRQIQGGEPHFWSIIPYWKGKGPQRRIHDGDPEND